MIFGKKFFYVALLSLFTNFTNFATASAKLGYCFFNENTGEIRENHGHEAFPMQSTFKLVLVAAVLRQAQENPKGLNYLIPVHQSDLVEWSPITKNFVKHSMTLKQLAEAALRYSDNSAANLLLDHIGGPNVLNRYAKNLIKANDFFLVNHEPNLSSKPNQRSDTCSPCGMLECLRVLLNSPNLSEHSRTLLKQWLLTNTTGAKRIRGGVPKSWPVGDKTGTGSYGITNDVAVIYPPKAKPIYLSIYRITDQIDATQDEKALADLTHTLLSSLK